MFNGQERMILGIIVIVYFMLLFGFSLYINKMKIKSYDDYNVAGRSVSIYPIILTFVGTAIGGASLLGYMQNAYSLGMGQQWLNIASLIAGVIVAYVFLKKIRQLGEKYNMVTIGDFTAMRFGESARIPTVISILVAYCAITGMQFVAIATILNLTIGLNITLGIVISWILLTTKTYFGGLKSVIWQDAIHGTIQTLGIVLLFVVVILVSGGWASMSENAFVLNQGDKHFWYLICRSICLFINNRRLSICKTGSMATILGSKGSKDSNERILDFYYYCCFYRCFCNDYWSLWSIRINARKCQSSFNIL